MHNDTSIALACKSDHGTSKIGISAGLLVFFIAKEKECMLCHKISFNE